MPTDLQLAVAESPLVDTHEHMAKEPDWTSSPPDILVDLFANYVPADFHAAGADAVGDLLNPAAGDVAARFAAVAETWPLIRHTGYGEAVTRIARSFFDLDELTPESLAAANGRAKAYRQPGERLRLLREVAGLDHIQTDDFVWPCPPDASGPEFFFHDLSWFSFCDGSVDLAAVSSETGQPIATLDDLRVATAALFAKHAPTAIAVKAQHAYCRTLAWRERSDAEVEALFRRKLAGEALPRAEADAFGDWCWARGVELSIEHHLPFKIHCGYYAGNDRMPMSYISAENLCDLLTRYPAARFVLMHASYPYSTELVALAKHYRNVTADLCWAWSMNPLQMVRFVREFIHAAPISKLFGFGGDTGNPLAAVAYAQQARRWLARALTEEVADGDLTEAEAIAVARRLMHDNQMAVFDLPGKRAAAREAVHGR